MAGDDYVTCAAARIFTVAAAEILSTKAVCAGQIFAIGYCVSILQFLATILMAAKKILMILMILLSSNDDSYRAHDNI